MAQEKSSFILRKKYRKQIELLNDEQAWMLLKAIMRLQDWEVLENTDPVVDMLISIMEEERRQDDEHYQKVCQKNKDNGSKGGRPVKNRTVIQKTQTNPTEPKKADNDNDIWIWYIKEKEDNKLSSKKKKYLEFVLLTDDEYNKLIEKYGKWTIERKITDLNNYIWSKWKKYKSHYFTILERLRKEWVKPIEKKPEPFTESNNLHIDTRPEWMKEAFPLNK